MNEDEAPIESVEAVQDSGAEQAEQAKPAEESTEDIQKMYDDLGIKAKAPTAKGRPKSTDVRAKDAPKKGNGDSAADEKGNAKSEVKPKDAPDSDKDGDAGNPADAKGSKKPSTDGKVSDEPEEAGDDVRETEPKPGEDSERRSEDGTDGGTDGAGQEADDEEDSTQEGKDDEGKRPGKSNPKVEQRFKKLTSEVRERDDYIEKLQKELNEVRQQQSQAKVDAEDPQYTIDDFRKVRDEDGNVLELDENEAELAWRRWQDGYNQRKSERDAEANRQQAQQQEQREASERLMRSSVAAYDALVDLNESVPELNPQSGKFDPEFSAQVMPVIRDAIIYQEGTEPGNENGVQPVILGMRMSPDKIVKAMQAVRQAKRSLPLNGTRDSVESPSTVGYTKGRSSDETVNAANELYKTLGINKRL